jgi:biopolymer transport protein ExbB
MSVVEITSWELFLKGGPLMWPILLCSVCSLAVAFERIFFFASLEKEMGSVRNAVIEKARKGDLKGAVALCDKSFSPMSAVFRAGILQVGRGRVEIRGAMEDASALQGPSLQRGLPFLQMVIQALPLLGFLGTVLAMASSIRTLELRAQAMNPFSFLDITVHVWAALMPTGFALLIALLVFLIANYLVWQLKDIIFRMEKGAAELLAILDGFSSGADEEGESA